MIGRQIAHYRVVEKLGSGGMGEVYVAEDLRLGRRIALKVLHPELTADAERHQRFQREATTIAGLNHPHIVTLHSLEEDAGVHFITMELVEGRTLADLLPRGGFALEQLLSLGIQIADAISAAHQRGIVHRDLKPGNIMVTGDARVKVLDFGLAKLREDLAAVDFASLPTEQLTGAGRILGTTAYMSPEQAEARSVDHRSDIFSLGIILYEMATGERPFKGESHLSVISSIIKETPPTVTDVNRALPRDIGRIIRRCLAKDPTRRYQSAADLRNELEDLSQEIRASGDSVVQPAPAGTRARRRRTLFIATAVAVLATLAIIAVRQRSQRGRPSGLPQPTFMQLTAEPGIERSPSLSSDGKWLVYSSNAEGQDDIYLRSVGGDVPILLTKDSPAADTEPVFSPDSERIAFRSERDGGGIFVMGRTGESVKRITDGGFNPSWSPDASEIVYATDNVTINPFRRAAPSRLWIVTVSTGARRLLSDADGVPWPCIHACSRRTSTSSPRRAAACGRSPTTGSSIECRGGRPTGDASRSSRIGVARRTSGSWMPTAAVSAS
ncbi:MAG: serine/threonine-protein kinase [Acidobacteria bacterium]|nr:serine/threonine-protein kinase [Acidobacteriota bacterium]